MSTNHTPNYDLCQWEAGDKVLREDFNADNAKIDLALAALSKASAMHGNCQISYLNYTGDGYSRGYVSSSFGNRPVFVILIGGGYVTIAAYGLTTAQCWDREGNYCEFPVTWKEHMVYWTLTPDKVAFQGNGDGIDYQKIVLLDMAH